MNTNQTFSEATSQFPAPEHLIELSLYLEGELAQDEHAAFQERLEQETALQQYMIALQDTLKHFRALSPIQAPDDFVQKVKRKVRRSSKKRQQPTQQFRLPWEIFAVIFALLAFLFFVLFSYQLQNERKSLIQKQTYAVSQKHKGKQNKPKGERTTKKQQEKVPKAKDN
ncbi:MAG: hypothetical protein AAGJ35_05410 [Myxococcota bacterium]